MKCPCCECEMISEMFDGDEGKRTESECPECGCTVNSTKIEVEKALKRFNASYEAILKKVGKDIERACMGMVSDKADAKEKKLPDAVHVVKDNIETKIDRMNIKDGDVLLVKTSGSVRFSQEYMAKIRGKVSETGRKNVVVVFVDGNVDLTVLDDGVMERNGWIRKDKVVELCGNIVSYVDKGGNSCLFNHDHNAVLAVLPEGVRRKILAGE